MNNSLIIMLLIIFFVLMIFNQYLYRENFSNYLFPFRKLSNECEKQGLKPAFMPTSCIVDEEYNPYANCKCMDKNGECKTCYDEIKKDMKGRSVVYNADEFNEKSNKNVNDYINFKVDSESSS